MKKITLIWVIGALVNLYVIWANHYQGQFDNEMYTPILWSAINFIPISLIFGYYFYRGVSIDSKRISYLLVLFLGLCLMSSIFYIQQNALDRVNALNGILYPLFLLPLHGIILVNLFRNGKTINENNELFKSNKNPNDKHKQDTGSKDASGLPGTNIVFISYNHNDKTTALQVKEYLERHAVEVIIDYQNNKASQDIKEFIYDSINKAAVTLSIVSSNSLNSSWVAMESMNTMLSEKIGDKMFIAGYIESSFLENKFVDNALNEIDTEISEIQSGIQGRLQKNRNIEDLDNALSRNNDLKHNLPKIISRLKDSYTVDITPQNFETGMKQILEAIS